MNRVFTPKAHRLGQGGGGTNIAHVPAALTAMIKENSARTDFDSEGSLALKPCFGANPAIKLPEDFNLPVVQAIVPYNAQIAAVINRSGPISAPVDEGCIRRFPVDSHSQVTACMASQCCKRHSIRFRPMRASPYCVNRAARKTAN